MRGKDISEVYIAGLAADYCVYYTAKDTIAEGFITDIIADAVKAISPEGFIKAKEDVIIKGGKIIFSSSFS